MADINSDSDIPIGRMSPEARDLYERSFLPRYKKLQEKVCQTPLVVLVWGPGSNDEDLYPKRVQILNNLRSCGHAACFSEEVDQDSPAPEFSSNARELFQAIEADFILLIQASPGSIAESHDVATLVHDIGSKMLIFIDEKAQEGYSYTGTLQQLKVLYNNVETYEYPKDIEECHLAQRVQRKLRVLQLAKWQRENLR